MKPYLYAVLLLLVGTLSYQGVRGFTKRTTITQKQVVTYTPTQQTVTPKSDDSLFIKTSASNVLYLDVPIDTESVNQTLQFLDEMTGPDIYLVLDSPGGSVVEGARLISYIEHSGKNIYTVCDNFCASMAFQIFEVGKKRYMADNAILMAHQASGGAQGTLENMSEMLNMFKKYIDRMDAKAASRSGIEYSKFKAMVANNVWVDTVDALDLKLADNMIFLSVTGSPKLASFTTNSVRSILKSKGLLTPKLLETRGYIFRTQ